MNDVTRLLARRLAGALEPVIGQVYFSPEAHAGYAALGFSGSSGDMNGVALPDGPAYFTSRGSVMGQVAPHVVTAAFAVFSPAVVEPCVTAGWGLTDADTIFAARDAGALGQLDRILSTGCADAVPSSEIDLVNAALAACAAPLLPAGRPLFAGLFGREVPDHRFGSVWRYGDQLREFRGDTHTAAWICAGFDATEIGLLTELYWGLPMRSYSRTRGWSDAEFDAAEERLRSRGLLDGAGLSDAGRSQREAIEVTTDEAMARVIEPMAEQVSACCDLLETWGIAIRDAAGYPSAGPHDLAERATPE